MNPKLAFVEPEPGRIFSLPDPKVGTRNLSISIRG